MRTPKKIVTSDEQVQKPRAAGLKSSPTKADPKKIVTSEK
jgi:hypothetical protein